MNSRHFFSQHIVTNRHSLLTLALLLPLNGCVGHFSRNNVPPPTLPPASDSQQSSPPTTHPDAMDAAIDPAELVARRTEAYSKAMEPAIARRVVPQLSSQPSSVQWGDPSDLRLSLMPEPATVAPSQISKAEVESSTVTANQATTTANTPKTEAASNAGAVAQPEPPTAVVASMTSHANGDDVATTDALSDKLSKRARDYPHDVSAQLDFQLAQFLQDKPVPNLSALSPLPTEDRELVTAVVDGLSNFRNNLRADNNMLLSRKIKPLLELADRLRSQADLTIANLVLCKEVRGFGNYDPWEGDPPQFSAGHEHPVILYCEVQNFCAQQDVNKMWQTQLTQDAVLYTENGYAAWTDKTQTVNDTARNRRQDFFIVQKLKLPANLVIGRYLLKVSIEDKQAKRVAEATLPLLVVAE